MVNQKNLNVYIGTTKTGAGIFLSSKIMDRKKYRRHLRVEVFACFSDAEDEFFRRYKDVIDMKQFRVNHLYPIKDKHMYSVFSSWTYVGVTTSEYAYENVEKILPKDAEAPYWRHNLNYEEAVCSVRNHFVHYYGDARLYIYDPIRLHNYFRLDEVRNRRCLK